MEELTNHVADGLKFVCVAYSLQTDTICKQRSAQHSSAQQGSLSLFALAFLTCVYGMERLCRVCNLLERRFVAASRSENPDSVETNMMLLSAWNEHDEGHWIEPALEKYGGAEKLVAIKKAIDKAEARRQAYWATVGGGGE
jgi:hypothetical protein